MNYPNKIYLSEYKGDSDMGYKSHFVIVTAASDSETARDYVKKLIGFDTQPIWLMNAVYPTIYISDGSKPEPVQVRILSNNNYHIKLIENK
jgi:hypothetical protein